MESERPQEKLPLMSKAQQDSSVLWCVPDYNTEVTMGGGGKALERSNALVQWRANIRVTLEQRLLILMDEQNKACTLKTKQALCLGHKQLRRPQSLQQNNAY